MLNKLQKFFYSYHLKKRLKKHGVRHQVVNFQKAEYVGIVFDGTDEHEVTTVLNYVHKLKKRNLKVNMLGFVDAKTMSENMSYMAFSRKEVNWFYKPTHHMPLEFTGKEFDILINAHTIESPTLEYIATFSNAKFRVGPYLEDDKTYCFDFMIRTKNDELADFLEEVDHYLEILNRL